MSVFGKRSAKIILFLLFGKIYVRPIKSCGSHCLFSGTRMKFPYKEWTKEIVLALQKKKNVLDYLHCIISNCKGWFDAGGTKTMGS